MKPFLKNSLALTLVGAVTMAAATPVLARSYKPWAAAGAGFVAGTAVGAAAANSRAYYGPGYYAGGAYGAYAYSPGDAASYSPMSNCATEGNYGGVVDYGAC